MTLSNRFELDGWEPKQIVITNHTRDEVTGTGTMTDTEGEYQIAFEWQMQMGENAEQYNLPFLLNVTAARFTQPCEFSVYECDGSLLDALEALQEMNCALDFASNFSPTFTTNTLRQKEPLTEVNHDRQSTRSTGFKRT